MDDENRPPEIPEDEPAEAGPYSDEEEDANIFAADGAGDSL